ncbi:MAG: sulfurtransferase complex subunit TusB [Oceanisphaera sp.]|uniref:sulfurtransferase complex subunit TusB n=1 Tax=Oceanisphaera sp. TaxID=1929979 RepID=UPI003C77B249
MLYTIKQSPFSHQALVQALAQMQPDDRLLLWQDAVIGATVSQWLSLLQPLAATGRLYVMQEDLQARGLTHQVGEMICMADWVRLVAEWGSPQAW